MKRRGSGQVVFRAAVAVVALVVLGWSPIGGAHAGALPTAPASPEVEGAAGAGPPVASRFHAVGPRRVLDTRPASTVGPYNTPFTSGVTRSVPIAGVGDVPAGAEVVVANITIGSPTGAGFATVWPAGQPWPTVSSLNFAAGQVVANQVTIKVGAGDAWSILVAGATADVLVDVTGWYGGAGDSFHPLPPVRVLDSRAATQVGPYSTPFTSGVTRPVTVAGIADVPAGAHAVVANVTIGNASAAGFLSVWASGQPWPGVSSVNFSSGQVIANQVTIQVGAGGAWSIVVAGASADVVIDIAGWYDGDGGDSLTPTATPARLLDTRAVSQIGPYNTPFVSPTPRNAIVTGGTSPVPATADAVVLNITVTNPTAAGYVTVWPAGQPMPTASSVNFTPGRTVPNAVSVKVGAGGAISILVAGGQADVLVDVFAWHAPPAATLVAGGDGISCSHCNDPYQARSVDGGTTYAPETSQVMVNSYLRTPTALLTAGRRQDGWSVGGLITRSTNGGVSGTTATMLVPPTLLGVFSLGGLVRTPGGALLATGLAYDPSLNTVPVIARSVDDGFTWTVTQSSGITDIRSTIAGLIGLASTGDRLVRSTNGGVTFTPDATPLGFGLTHLYATPFGLIGTNAGGAVFRSTDAGVTWSGPGVTSQPVTDLVATAGGLVAVGTGSTQAYVTRSTDGGATWVDVATADLPLCLGLSAVISSSVGLVAVGTTGYNIGDGGCAARSTDGGRSWTTTLVGTSSLGAEFARVVEV